MKVYLVVFDWKTEGEQGVDVYAFHSYKDAAKMFNEIIETEKTHDLSWAANAFDEDGNVYGNYEYFEELPNCERECPAYWSISNDYDYRDDLYLKIVEVE